MGRILLAEPARDYQTGLREVIAPGDRLECCATGEKTLELLRQYAPDVLVLDMRLADVDGTWVLRRAKKAGLLPTTIVTGYYFGNDMLRLLDRYGVAAILQKTYQPQSLLELLNDLLDTASAQEPRRFSAQDWISNTLIFLGVLTNQSGFQYLRDGIHLKVETPNMALTKELYPAVAKRHGVSPDAVEKAMRTAVRTAYNRGDPKQWQRLFGTDRTGRIPLPANGQFISRLAESYKSERESFLADCKIKQ